MLPAPGETPVYSGPTGTAPGAVGAVGGNLAGTNQVVNPPRSVLHASHPRRHYYARFARALPVKVVDYPPASAAGDRRAWPSLACGASHSCAGRWARLRCLRKAVAGVAANGGVDDRITDARRVRRCGLMATLSSFRSARNGTRLSRSGQRTWDGPHTSLRLIQAFKTLSAIPVANGPRFKSSWWPAPSDGMDRYQSQRTRIPERSRSGARSGKTMGTDTTPGFAGRSQPYGSGSVLAGTLSAPSSSGDACCADGRAVPIDRL